MVGGADLDRFETSTNVHMNKVVLITGSSRGIVWLLSDEASDATGTFIDLAGGK